MKQQTNITKLCPLCGQPNRCTVAEQRNHDKPCWCRSTIFPEALLEKIPQEFQRKACLCENCLKTFKANQQPSP